MVRRIGFTRGLGLGKGTLNEGKDFISRMQLLAYLAEWEDRQVCLIPCWASYHYIGTNTPL
jgi:hypothetical protein